MKTLAIGALALCAGAVAAQTPATIPLSERLARIELGFEGSNEAPAELAALVKERRPADGVLRTDPLLNGLYGRVLLENGRIGEALPYLERGWSPDVPEAQRIAAGLALAAAQEQTGDLSGATATLDRLEAEPLAQGKRQQAAFARARLALLRDPRAAIALSEAAAAIRPGTGAAWQAGLIRGQALALSGDPGGAAAAARQAWAAAPEVASGEAAPLRSALLLGALAARTAAADRLAAMLSAAGARRSPAPGDAAEVLPLCGEDGIAPEDHVTFGLFSTVGEARHLMPLEASRPAAVAPFYQALAGHVAVTGGAEPGEGTLFTVRCRTTISTSYDAPALRRDAFADWFAERGLYPAGRTEHSVEAINAAAEDVAELEERYGAEHPLLIPPRLDLYMRLTLRAASADDIPGWQIEDLRRKIQAGFAAQGSDHGAVLDLDPRRFQALLQNARSPEEGLRLARTEGLRLVQRLPLDHAYRYAGEWLRQDTELPSETHQRMLEALLARFPENGGDRRRSALLMRLAELQRKRGDLTAARRSLRTAGVSPASCAAADEPPTIAEAQVTDEDYPPLALKHGLEGISMIEMEVGADGRVASHRLILSAPSALFDQVIARELQDFRYNPARAGGRARSCRGVYQRIVWRMPEDDPAGWSSLLQDRD
jgi:tetratricopeptide (TPR) repeat protein